MAVARAAHLHVLQGLVVHHQGRQVRLGEVPARTHHRTHACDIARLGVATAAPSPWQPQIWGLVKANAKEPSKPVRRPRWRIGAAVLAHR